MNSVQSNTNIRFTSIVNAALLVIVLICIVLIFLTVVGYGRVELNVPSNTFVTLNNHTVKQNSMKVRPGDYTVIITTPNYKTLRQTIKVSLFRTTVVKPSFSEREPSAIISSLIGSYGSYGPPELFKEKWYENNTWLVGSVGPGSASQVVINYANHSWNIVYFNGVAGYPTDTSRLPENVLHYLQELQSDAG